VCASRGLAARIVLSLAGRPDGTVISPACRAPAGRNVPFSSSMCEIDHSAGRIGNPARARAVPPALSLGMSSATSALPYGPRNTVRDATLALAAQLTRGGPLPTSPLFAKLEISFAGRAIASWSDRSFLPSGSSISSSKWLDQDINARLSRGAAHTCPS
jgi:hypothetical protein